MVGAITIITIKNQIVTKAYKRTRQEKNYY